MNNNITSITKNSSILTFLIIRFSSIGDIVLTTPVVRCLKNQVAGCKIHYVTKKEYAGIVKNNPYIDKVIEYDGDWDIMMRELKTFNYDYIIDLHHNARTMRLKGMFKNVKAFSFNKINVQKWMLTALKINMLPNKHIVDRYFETITSFNVTNDGKGLDYFIPEVDEIKQSDIPSSHLFGYIGIVIGAAHNTKKLPLNKLKELVAKINYPVILMGGKEDQAMGDEIAAIDSGGTYNACGKFSLNESADLVRKAKLIITNDTGLMHIAAAFKKPIISIWGNTVPSFGMTPYYGTMQAPNAMFQVENLKCRPCTKIGYNKCPKKHFNCMQQQNIDSIVETIKGMIK
ncbi:MAG: glycosyltransferase family 9 protein [Bacteroidetes bacterium]|nr:glycosyltransferase family 9 protein [Bacteroidota bacterium]